MRQTINYEAFRAALPQGSQMNLTEKALGIWNPQLKAEDDNGVATISILDVIGSDFWGEGVTPARIAGALRAIGPKNPVIVNINSPGGDMFDGIAIHNMLAEHKGKVTVKVLGLAASAASVIAVAADEVQIAKSAFFMLHNAWLIGAGNRHDFRALADYLEPFDKAMRDLFADATGADADVVEDWLDGETWFGSADAIEAGLADSTLEDPESENEPNETTASATMRKIDKAMAKGGLSRAKRREYLNTLKLATPGASEDDDTPCAIKVGEVATLANKLRGIL